MVRNIGEITKEMNSVTKAKLDALHIQFMNENEDLGFKEIRLVLRIFDFLKKNL